MNSNEVKQTEQDALNPSEKIPDLVILSLLVLYICVGELGQHWFGWWLLACLVPIHYLNQCWLTTNRTLGNKLQWYSIKAPSHLDVWRERVNIVWENHQHVQKRTCVPVNHRLACSTRISNISKTTYHRVNTVWVTFSQRFHSVCERVPTCQTSVQRVLNVYMTPI